MEEDEFKQLLQSDVGMSAHWPPGNPYTRLGCPALVPGTQADNSAFGPLLTVS